MYKIFIVFTILFFTSCASKKEKNIICYEKPKAGLCKGYFQKYYYDTNKNKCSRFYWGGCAGNVPFHKINQCKKTCEDN